MKFWKKLIESIDNVRFVIAESSIDILKRLYSIEFNLSKVYSWEANPEPIKTVNSTPLQLAAQDGDRKKIIIQNIGLEPCQIKLDERISKEEFHFVLAPDTSPNFGNGGSITLDDWHGEVYAICEKETKLSVMEY